MFIDYQMVDDLGYDYMPGAFVYKILIITDDFSESIIVNSHPDFGRDLGEVPAAVSALIKIYAVRQLNAAHDLYLLCKKINEKFPKYTIDKQIKDYIKYIPEFSSYQKQVKQYHIRYNNQKVFW